MVLAVFLGAGCFPCCVAWCWLCSMVLAVFYVVLAVLRDVVLAVFLGVGCVAWCLTVLRGVGCVAWCLTVLRGV